MSIGSVKNAIRKAVETPSGRTPTITRDEARAIIKAAAIGARGPDGVSGGEAKLLAQLAGTSGFETSSAPAALTGAARQELEAFFTKNNLPLGANAEKLRTQLEARLAGADLSSPLAKAPSTRGLNALTLDAGREAFLDPKKGTFFLKSTDGSKVRWYGPLSIAQEAQPESGLEALRARIALATKDLLFMSESDYPFEPFLAQGAGKTQPTPEQFLELLGKPADSVVEVRSFDEFFADRTTPEEWWGDYERADAAKYTELRAALESGLTDLQVIRVGEIEIGVYLVGRNPEGDLVGVSTVSIET